MDLNHLTRDADDLIRKVVLRYNQLYVPAGNISQLELDLMLDDLRKLYDTFKNIGQINLTLQHTLNKPEVKVNTTVLSDSQKITSATPSYSEKQFISPEPAQAPPQPQPEVVPIAETVPEYISEPEYNSEPETETATDYETKDELIAVPEIKTEPVYGNQEPPVSQISDNKRPQDSVESSNPGTAEPASAMLADKFSTGSKSLSETLASSQPQGVIGSRALLQPITDLTTGIGLNDKFSFISDLFGNNATQYDEAIHRINKAVNLDEANWILQKYHTPEWDHKQETLARLKDFVKRRFV